MKQRLDTYEKLPAGMAEYLANYGWHFSKKMAEWAVGMMRDRNGAQITMKDRKNLDDLMKMNGLDTSAIEGYDAVYVEAMARSDYYGSAITDDQHLYKFVRDYLADQDGYEGVALTRFYADCMAKGKPVYWEDLL